MNTSYLKDEEYVQGIHNIINSVVSDIHSNCNNKRILWDILKMKVKEFSITFSKQKARQNRSRQSNLEKKERKFV